MYKSIIYFYADRASHIKSSESTRDTLEVQYPTAINLSIIVTLFSNTSFAFFLVIRIHTIEFALLQIDGSSFLQ